MNRNDSNNKGRSMDAVPSPLSAEKTEGTMALVKSSSEKVKSTPAGEYLTTALNDFDPEQYDSLAAISDGANKLLMLVRLFLACPFETVILLSHDDLCCSSEDLQWCHLCSPFKLVVKVKMVLLMFTLVDEIVETRLTLVLFLIINSIYSSWIGLSNID